MQNVGVVHEIPNPNASVVSTGFGSVVGTHVVPFHSSTKTEWVAKPIAPTAMQKLTVRQETSSSAVVSVPLS